MTGSHERVTIEFTKGLPDNATAQYAIAIIDYISILFLA